MSQQDGIQSSTKQHKSRKTNTTNQQNGKQAPAAQRPANKDTEAWKAYWKAQGQPWRTEPEINTERQKYLDERRSIKPDIEQGIFPFKGIKMSRADVEWLLATHEDGRGPVDWRDKFQGERDRLDVRGADLREVNLSNLPLTRIRGGLSLEEWHDSIVELIEQVGLQCSEETEKRISIAAVYLNKADLHNAHLEGADLWGAHLESAHLWGVNLKGASLISAHLEGANLRRGFLEDADLSDIRLSDEKRVGPMLADIQWSNANLAVVKWKQVKILGDESWAYDKKFINLRLGRYEEAVRAYRQLSVVLRTQGLNEDAARFAYRAQLMQRKVFWYQGIQKFGQYLFSLFLDLLAGYGHKAWRSFLAYLIVITVFATFYYIIGHTVRPALSPLGAWVFSMTSFHGRGFFPGGIGLDDPLTVLAAIEAFVGLLIEVTFIATLTQRLFGK